MAKNPKKYTKNGKAMSPYKSPARKTQVAHNKGGKNLKAYGMKNYNKTGSFSIRDSSESETRDSGYNNHQESSGSDSSLTDVSDAENLVASRKGSVILDFETSSGSKDLNVPKNRQGGKSKGEYGTKRAPKKGIHWGVNHDDHDHDESDSSGSEDDNLVDLYSTTKQSVDDSDNDSENNSENDSEDFDDSSSDDSDVDFVKLQAERKAKSFKSAKSMKMMSKKAHKGGNRVEKAQKGEHGGKSNQKKKSAPLKYRKRSETALPEDINFSFDFNEVDNEEAIIDDAASNVSLEEEDMGEEVDISFDSANNSRGKLGDDLDSNNLGLGFDTPLIEVPKLGADEINSDDDYEIDDNELLATLQADNDLDEFTGINAIKRNKSYESLGDDENDQFLKEEEKFLVNEFENNGFDDDTVFAPVDQDANQTKEKEDLVNSVNALNDSKDKVIQYADDNSESENLSDIDEDEDDYVDFIDFGVPFVNSSPEGYEDKSKNIKSTNSNTDNSYKKRAKSSNFKGLSIGNSDEDDDDSYLWNYFFSSDDSSSNDRLSETEYDSGEREIPVEDWFHEIDKTKRTSKPSKPLNVREVSQFNSFESSSSDEDDYDSGESTDVDDTLPTSNGNSKLGSKSAKEVLSSRTADYRPPVLGTWIAIDTRPFGIIDGMSTRMLTGSHKHADLRSRQKKQNYGSMTNSDNSAMGLDELLNISELDDDDENDAKIWRDFNNQNKRIPLGAFRNKSTLQHAVIHPENITTTYNHTTKSNSDFNRRRYSLSNHHPPAKTKKPAPGKANQKFAKSSRRSSMNGAPSSPSFGHIPSKSKRRRSSIVEAVAEGLRPTKSGLFSENALTNVEEVFGDDNDIMSLVKGL